MKVLVTGDWHIGVLTYGVLDNDGRNSRLVDIEKTLNDIIGIAESNHIDLLICTGDVFHTNRPTIEEQLVFYRFISSLKGCSFKSRFIIGNHDYNSKLGAQHALAIFKEIVSDTDGKIIIYDATTWEHFNDDELAVCFYPYHGAEPSYTGDSAACRARALVCHSHLEGAVVGAEPFEIKSDSVTRFSQLPVDFVWAGHFHKPQVLCKKPIAFYPGSIQAVDFNEREDVKGVVIFDTNKCTMAHVPIYCRKLVQIDTDKPFLDDSQLVDIRDSIVKVNITIDEKSSEAFNEVIIRNKLVNAGAHSIAGINLNIIREEVRRNPSIKLESDLSSNFERFIGDRDYGDHHQAVRERGLQIIRQCGL